MPNLYSNNLTIEQHVNRLLDPTIEVLLRESRVQEVSVNADGRIRIDDGGPWEYLMDVEPIPAAFAETTIRMIASANNIWIEPDAPIVETYLACGAHFSAAHPPLARGGEFTIRTHVRIFRPLTAFMTDDQAEWTRRQIIERNNIIVARRDQHGKDDAAEFHHRRYIRPRTPRHHRGHNRAADPTIAEAFGRDHSTTLHNCDLIRCRMARDTAFRSFVQRLERQIADAAMAVAMATTQAAA